MKRSDAVWSLVLSIVLSGAACDRGDFVPRDKMAAEVATPDSTLVDAPTSTAGAGAAAIGGAGSVAVATSPPAMIAAGSSGTADAWMPAAGSGEPKNTDAAAPQMPAPPMAAQPPPPACSPNAYVANSGSNTLSVIDTRTHQVVATVPTGTAPVNPTFAPDRKHLYVANSQANTLTVVDVDTNVPKEIPAGGERPSGLAFLPDGQRLVVTLLGETIATPGNVTIITLATGEASPPIPVGAQPERLALTPDGSRAYVSNLGEGSMSVVDLTERKVTTTIMLGDLPFNPLMSPDGKVLYVGVMLSNKIVLVDPQTNQIASSIDVDSPNGMAFSLDYKSLYVTSAFGSAVDQISLDTKTVVKSNMVGGLPGYIALLPDGKHAYFVRPDGTTVEVVDTATLMIVDTISVESVPSTVAVCREPRAPAGRASLAR